MGYEAMGAVHAWVARAWARGFAADERGQGTVEYVGLILLVAVILAGVLKASGSFSDKGIADAVVKKMKAAIDGVGK
jgi:Flp pilus assembly pilin Flp